MPTALEYMRVFQESMRLCREQEKLQSAVARSIREQKLYWEHQELPAPAPKYDASAKLILSAKRTFEAAEPYAKQGKRVCALNFANAFVPGGGVTKGSTAQEECLCRASTLYPALSDESAASFYSSHNLRSRNHEMNGKSSHDCLFTPGVIVFREDTSEYAMLPEDAWYALDVVTCAAPDLRPTVYYDNPPYDPEEEELEELFFQRIGRILTIAAMNGAEVLILGAFGCGAFLNPPEVVVRAFNRALGDFTHHFETIEFAVYSSRSDAPNLRAFQRIEGIVLQPGVA